MRAQSHVYLHTWYGLVAEVGIHHRFFHRAGFKGLLIPHFPLFNWVLRSGLPFIPYRKLAVLHEFGHLQTLPGVVLYLAAAALGFTYSSSWTVGNVLALLIGAHLLWELLAEKYVRWRTGPYYRWIYLRVRLWPRVLFWAGTLLSFALTWVFVVAYS